VAFEAINKLSKADGRGGKIY